MTAHGPLHPQGANMSTPTHPCSQTNASDFVCHLVLIKWRYIYILMFRNRCWNGSLSFWESYKHAWFCLTTEKAETWDRSSDAFSPSMDYPSLPGQIRLEKARRLQKPYLPSFLFYNQLTTGFCPWARKKSGSLCQNSSYGKRKKHFHFKRVGGVNDNLRRSCTGTTVAIGKRWL